MSKKTIVILCLGLVSILCLTGVAWSEDNKLLCISNKDLRGETTVGSCLAKGEKFAIVDQYGVVRILTPEEIELTKATNPGILEQRAFGIKFGKEAPPLKVFGTVPVTPAK